MPLTRPGFKLVTSIVNGHEAQTWERDDPDGPREPTQEELEEEVEGAVLLGVKHDYSPASAGRQARHLKYEILSDLKNPYKTWRRYADGTIVRMFSKEPAPKSIPLGVFSGRPTDSPTDEAFGPRETRSPEPTEPNPFDRLDPDTRDAVVTLLGLRR